jgi:hypothetical protein
VSSPLDRFASDFENIFGPAKVATKATLTVAPSPPPAAECSTSSVSGELLRQIFGGIAPQHVTRQAIIDQATAYVMDRIERDGFCVLHDWPAWLYHSLPFIGSTLLKGYAELPSTCRKPWIPGDDGNMGSGIHAYTLQGEPGLQEECFILPLSCEGKGKPALAERAMYESRYPGKALLPPVYGPEKVPAKEVLLGVDASFREHPKTRQILANSQREVSLIWVDESSGLTCKARLDAWDKPIIWDVKKCKKLDKFTWVIKDLFYEVQAGHYFNGAVACRLAPVAFGFLPCEAFPPYRVTCGYLDPEKLLAASMEAVRLIGLVKQSTETGYWPNFRVPSHIYDLDAIKPDDLVTVW